MAKFFKSLPFRRMAEKISPETRAKHPLLNKLIPHANTIGGILLILVLLLVVKAVGFARIRSFLDNILGFLRDSQNVLDKAGQIVE